MRRRRFPLFINTTAGAVFIFCWIALLGLSRTLSARTDGNDRQKVWIYLDTERLKTEDFVPFTCSPRTAARLLRKGIPGAKNFSATVPGEHIRAAIERCCREILFYSRALQAYSVYVDSTQILSLLNLPYIKELQAVRRYHRTSPPAPRRQLEKSQVVNPLYGNSYAQLQRLNVPAVHELGFTGAGVRIAVIDAGFYKDHEAFQHIVADGRLVAERDFIFKDNDVQDDQTGSKTISAQCRHGTSVWSLIGGYVANTYIGAAYNAEFLLAKTEILASETPLEEDYFVAAVEWADQSGADIISSSVAYRYDFDNPANDHPYEDLDGRTTPVARAVNWAFERGILPVICAGNAAQLFSDGGLMSPSDAFGALTIGAVNLDGQIAGFSSHGPTPDGRIKPDLCAPGVNIFVASSGSPTSYNSGDGTSYATPLIAGSAALLMEKYPTLTPAQIIEILKSSASRSSNPDQSYGWGVPDIYHAMFAGDSLLIPGRPLARKRLYALPNPAISDVALTFLWTHAIPTEKKVPLNIYNLLGELIWSTELKPKIAGTQESIYWNLKNLQGQKVSSGIYIVTINDRDTIIRGNCLVLH
ncbi:MAG TPA: hypothetical protein ENN20_01000 [Candidatus Marinimicrobia bacterium]|nr:hypothetical protein [Candidatus Neomarinimicrobiota bacterium]